MDFFLETYYFIAIFFVSVFLCLIPAKIAEDKGYSHTLWWCFGMFISFPIAFILSLVIKDKSLKLCPNCSEKVKKDAKICRFCNYSFNGQTKQTQVKDQLEQWEDRGKTTNTALFEMLSCPYCQKNLFLRKVSKGKKYKCPFCKNIIEVDDK